MVGTASARVPLRGCKTGEHLAARVLGRETPVHERDAAHERETHRGAQGRRHKVTDDSQAVSGRAPRATSVPNS